MIQATDFMNTQGWSNDDYTIQSAQESSRSDAAQNGIIDIEPDIEQYFTPGSTTDLAQQRAAGGFTGAWKVLIDGEEVYQFSGIGNNQGDANRVGRDWILQQIRQGTLQPVDGADIEILPVMSNA
jgi:hypothetical protein